MPAYDLTAVSYVIVGIALAVFLIASIIRKRMKAKTALVCQGRAPEPGCGKALTPDERHWYGDCCEKCEERWDDRIDTWRAGGADADLDAMFGCPQSKCH